jgi:hypothetical protein
MPYAAGAVLVGFLASVLWPYVLIFLGLGVIFAIVGWMIEHPIFGISIVVSIYWFWSVHVGMSTMSGDASLEQGGRQCVAIRAATIAIVLSLLAYVPFVLALVGSVIVIATIVCLERNGAIVKYEAIGNILVIGPGYCYGARPPGPQFRRVVPKGRSSIGRETDVVQSVAQWRRSGFKDPRQKEIERRTRNFMSGRTAKF